MKKYGVFIIVLICLLMIFIFTTINASSSNNFIKGTSFIETKINKKLQPSNYGVYEHSNIIWSLNKDGGATATIEYPNTKVKIEFSAGEINSASEGRLLKNTKNKIDKSVSAQPGGGGPLH